MTWVLRERRDADLQECAALLAQVHLAQRYPLHWPDDPGAWLTPPGLAAAWVSVRGDEVTGHVCLVRGDPGPDLTLERLFVSPVATGDGVGSALVVQASDWAARRRSRLTLDVAENCTRAVTLYDRLGWRLTGRTPIDWGDDAAHWLLHFEDVRGGDGVRTTW